MGAKSSPAATSNPGVGPDGQPLMVKDDPRLAKFFKMLSVGVAPEAVKMKMQNEGFFAHLLDTPEAPVPAHVQADPLPPVTLAKDDPRMATFLKMLSAGVPLEAVKSKMQLEGFLPDVLDGIKDTAAPS